MKVCPMRNRFSLKHFHLLMIFTEHGSFHLGLPTITQTSLSIRQLYNTCSLTLFNSSWTPLMVKPLENSISKESSTATKDIYITPPQLEYSNTHEISLAATVATELFALKDFDGIVYGTDCKRTSPIHRATQGLLLQWSRQDRLNFVSLSVNPSQPVSLEQNLKTNWSQTSSLLYYCFPSKTMLLLIYIQI